MPRLQNSKHELFAQALADGKNAAESYIAAGYKANTGNASTLKAQESVSKRVAEILAEREKVHGQSTAKAIERAALTKEWVLTRLREVAERSMQAEPVLDRKGEPVLVETPSGEVKPAYVFNSAGANRALELLGKELGMFIDRKEVRTGALDGLTVEERDAAIAAIRSELERRSGGSPAGEEPEPPSRVSALH